MENVQMCDLSQKGPQVHGGRKVQFLSFLQFSKMTNIIVFSLQDKYTNPNC